MESEFTKVCKRLEHYETPLWAVEQLLEKEKLQSFVLDPCCGTGILSEAAKAKGIKVYASDITDWGYQDQKEIYDFLKLESRQLVPSFGFDVLMNPPFSTACEFVKKSLDIGAQKVYCFQRFAWYESRSRKEFFDAMPLSKIILCGSRASCWRHDIPFEKRKKSGTTTAHAWFVFDPKHSGPVTLDRIYKPT